MKLKRPVADLNDLADVAKQDACLDPFLLQLLRGVQVERLLKESVILTIVSYLKDFTLVVVKILSCLKDLKPGLNC